MTHKSQVVLASFLAAFVSGCIDQYFYPGKLLPPTAIAFTLVGTCLVFDWYYMDSRERHYPRSFWLNVAVVGLSLFALPYYFFRSRGFTQGALATLVFLCVMIATGFTAMCGQSAVYYVLQS